MVCMGSSVHRLLAALGILSTSLASGVAQATCPVGKEIKIDDDIPGSGYSEESPNWATWKTDPCGPPAYRYLSHTVGDGSRKGKAIWKPAIQQAGHYKVSTGFRATENRTNDADYYLHDDSGKPALHKEIDQSKGNACVWVDLGTVYCVPGGQCRLVLHGDDGKSDEADLTIFKLLDCDAAAPVDPPKPGRCDGIRATSAYEVCSETDTTCAGVFTNGAGCNAYCAAAGMTCKARFGGEPGCNKEPQNPIPCGANNGHASDWCECEGPSLPAGTGGSDPGTGGSDPGTGGSDPGTGGSDPGTGGSDPGTGGGDPGTGGGDPAAGTGGSGEGTGTAGEFPFKPGDAGASQGGAAGSGANGGAGGNKSKPKLGPGNDAAVEENSGCALGPNRGEEGAPLALGLLVLALRARRRKAERQGSIA
jgi:hypothetical protein